MKEKQNKKIRGSDEKRETDCGFLNLIQDLGNLINYCRLNLKRYWLNKFSRSPVKLRNYQSRHPEFFSGFKTSTPMYFVLCTLLLFTFFLIPNSVHAGIINKPPASTLNITTYLTFDGDSVAGSTISDVSGNGNDGTAVNSPIPVPGKIGQALEFESVDEQYIESQTLDSSQPFSIIFWAKFDELADNNDFRFGLVNAWNNYTSGIAVYQTSDSGSENKIIFRGFNGSSGSFNFASIEAIEDNDWHLIAVTSDGSSEARISIDGNTFSSSALSTIPSGNTAIQIGQEAHTSAGNNEHFDGQIDEFKIYNTVLTLEEIQRVYNAGKITVGKSGSGSSLDDGLVGHWTFDGNDVSGTTISDVSGNGNDGTAQNGAVPASGKIGQAYEFDGVNDNVLVGDINENMESVSLWFYSDVDIDKNTAGMSPININGSSYGIFIGSATSAFADEIIMIQDSVGARSAYISASDVVSAGWHNIIMVFNGVDNYDIYLDGNQVNSHLLGNFSPIDADNVNIGKRIFGDLPFDGKIDDVRIYNRPLSDAEIKSLYGMGATKFNTSRETTVDSGLLAHFTFDGSTVSGSTATNLAPGGIDGAIQNGASPVIGKIGQALDFEFDNSQYLTSANTGEIYQVGTGDFSVSTWVKLEEGSALSGSGDVYNIAFLGNNTAVGYWNLALRGSGSYNGFMFRVGDSGNTTLKPDSNMSSTFLDYNWHMVTAVRDKSNANKYYMYIDGVEVSDTAISTDYDINPSNLNPINIGISDYGGPDTGYFDGGIDDFRYYGRALSAQEIQTLYNLGK